MKKDHLEVPLEDVNDKLDRLNEGMSSLQTDVHQVKSEVARLSEVPADIKTIKAAITDQSRQLRRHEHILGDQETRLHGLEHVA